LGLQFRSIDDYSFWGVISKYLFIFNALPHNTDYINPSFLSYTPALASVHYLLYTLAHQYSAFLGYFAQDMVIISAWMVVCDEKNTSRSVLNLSLCYIGFTFGFGAIFGRMEVDAYVAAYFFAILWVIHKKGLNAFSSLVIPFIFLSVIKEIGMFFSLSTLMIYAILGRPKREKILYFVLLSVAIMGLKALWKYHVSSLGFQSFAKAISWRPALDSLNPLNPWYHKAQILYLKAVFLSSFDHFLHIPYVLVYSLIFLLYRNLIKILPKKISQTRTLIIGLLLTALIYLVLLYWLQAIVFGIGHGFDRTLDFSRYYNMLFLPWLLILVFIVFYKTGYKLFNDFKNPTSLGVLVFAVMLLLGGKVERMYKHYNPNHVLEFSQRVKSKIDTLSNQHGTVCVVNPPTPEYQTILPLTYFVMPYKVIYLGSKEHNVHCDWFCPVIHANQ
jgi:hypothetical protein